MKVFGDVERKSFQRWSSEEKRIGYRGSIESHFSWRLLSSIDRVRNLWSEKNMRNLVPLGRASLYIRRNIQCIILLTIRERERGREKESKSGELKRKRERERREGEMSGIGARGGSRPCCGDGFHTHHFVRKVIYYLLKRSCNFLA